MHAHGPPSLRLVPSTPHFHASSPTPASHPPPHAPICTASSLRTAGWCHILADRAPPHPHRPGTASSPHTAGHLLESPHHRNRTAGHLSSSPSSGGQVSLHPEPVRRWIDAKHRGSTLSGGGLRLSSCRPPPSTLQWRRWHRSRLEQCGSSSDGGPPPSPIQRRWRRASSLPHPMAAAPPSNSGSDGPPPSSIRR
jgi:hypothetical protein